MEFSIVRELPRVPHKKHWQFCTGSPHALMALRTDYTRQLKFIHDNLGIERVRFHGIFCDDMRTFTDLSSQLRVPGAERFEEYNFNAIGVAYDNVLEVGMKPLVELSFMPEKLAIRDGRPLQGAFFYRPNIVPPADWEAWRSYIQAFIRFLLKRYGADEVHTWMFEVWNEPDLPFVFWNGSREEYFELYAHTVRAVKEVDPALKVGGPATSGSKWISSFLKYCRENGVPVDFVSTHQYAGDPLGGVEDQGDPEEGQAGGGESWAARLAAAEQTLKQVKEKTFLAGYRATTPDKSETTDIPNDLFRKNSARAREQAGSLPLYYTEWNESAIFSAYTNDTRKVAAYDVKTALDVAGNVDGSSIWCFSDIFEELHPFVQEFHGGFGMLTQHGIPKPVYYAMKLLADAPDTRIDLGPDATDGELGIAAFEGNNETHVLLFRQKMKNLELPKEEAVIRLAMAQRPEGVTLRRVDESHGNPLRLWEEMGSPEQLTPAEVEGIRARSEVRAEDWPFEWADGVLTLKAQLGVNDVYGFVIRSLEQE